ncbi:MAG TPA: ammonia channel protein, partial [Gemmatimonadaceae bacterium]|nr:ammonia channel protein [Gemmatimonadaceae bacterium]
VFANKAINPAGADGLLAGNAALLGVQTIAVLATIAFVAVMTPAVVILVNAVTTIRVSLADELAGVDTKEHREEGYHGGGLSEFAGQAVTLGQRVVLPAHEVFGQPAINID